MNTYTWKINTLEAIPQTEGLQKVVSRIMATMIATADDGLTSAHTVNVQAGPYDAANFIGFDDLTEDVVVGWLEACLGEENLTQFKAMLDQRIVQMRNVQLTPPWEEPLPTVV